MQLAFRSTCRRVPHRGCALLKTASCFAGTYFFTTGCILLTVESLNLQYDEQLAAWKSGDLPAKPKFVIFGCER